MRKTENTVTAELRETREYLRKEVIPQQSLEILDRSIEALIESHVLDKSLKAGQTAPDFTLPNQNGTPVRLYDLLESGPVVLTFYRGGWCPYCNIALRGLQRYQEKFKQKRATLVAVSPQLPDQSLSTAEKADLSFPVLSDVGNKVADSYGISYKVSSDLSQLLESFGNPLENVNGAEGAYTLPAPSTFVITEDGKITLAYVQADFTDRLDPEDALAAI